VTALGFPYRKIQTEIKINIMKNKGNVSFINAHKTCASPNSLRKTPTSMKSKMEDETSFPFKGRYFSLRQFMNYFGVRSDSRPVDTWA
jgi:hypothetical protein